MKLRLKFEKTGRLKYIGHLDLLRLFNRVFRMAQIPVSFSNGFNPHMLLHFASPLPLGVSSIAEYLDVEIYEAVNLEQIISNINAHVPKGLKIIKALNADHSKKVTSIVSAGLYEIQKRESFNSEMIERYLSQPEILIEKKTKKNSTVSDIKPLIYSMSVSGGILTTTIATGSEKNLKAIVLLESLCIFQNIDFKEQDYEITRTELYSGTTPNFLTLDQVE